MPGPAATGLRAGAAALILAAWAAVARGDMPAPAEATTIDVGQLRLVFSEEFDGPLDVSPWGPGTRWIAHTPWNGDFGDAVFTDPTPDFPFTIADGILRIEARKDDEGRWRSGILASADPHGEGFSRRYGYFEMRAKLPDGPGVWPAFWMSSIADPQADLSVEIDVLEYYGHDPAAYQSAVHVWWKDGRHTEVKKTHRVEHGTLTRDFHTYGVHIGPDWIVFYLDSVERWRTPTPPEHTRPVLMMLNLALGSGWPIDQTPDPSHMFVDYVRVYAADDDPD